MYVSLTHTHTQAQTIRQSVCVLINNFQTEWYNYFLNLMKLQLLQKAFQKFYSFRNTLVAKRRRRGRGLGRGRNYRRRIRPCWYWLWFMVFVLTTATFAISSNAKWKWIWYLCGAKSSTTTTTTTCVLQIYLIKMYFMRHTQTHTHRDILLLPLPFLIFIASKNFCFAILSLSPRGNCLLTRCCCSCSYCCFIYLPNTCRWQHKYIFHINCAFFTSLSFVNWLAMRRFS